MSAPPSSKPGRLPRITVLGSLNMDLVSYVSHHPAPGETMTAERFAVSPGGKGANQAVACAKLSRVRRAPDGVLSASTATAAVAMVGRVGDDAHGEALKANLAVHGVDVSGVQTVDGGVPTGVAVIVVDEPTGENRIIVSPGANHGGGGTDNTDNTAAEAEADVEEDEKALVDAAVSGTDLLVLQLEVPLRLVTRALTAAKERGVAVLLNPAPAPTRAADMEALEAAWRGGENGNGNGELAHLVLNETETAALVPEVTVEELETEDGLARAAASLLLRGVQHVVLTLGSRGVYYAPVAAAESQGRVGLLVPAERVVRVVDTTGAGDTFAGQYALDVVAAAARGERFDCGAAVRRAQKASARTVQRRGAQDSIPWRDELLFDFL